MLVDNMGKVLKPEDMVGRRRKIVEEGAKDLSPGIRATARIGESGVGKESEERFVKLLGEEEAKRLKKKIKRV